MFPKFYALSLLMSSIK